MINPHKLLTSLTHRESKSLLLSKYLFSARLDNRQIAIRIYIYFHILHTAIC